MIRLRRYFTGRADAFTRSVGFRLVVLIGLLGLTLGSAAAQTPPPTPDPPPPTRPDGTTSDYLADPLRLLFPSAPASLELTDTEPPYFASNTPAFDLLSLGVLNPTQPLSKTLTLELGGGIRGRVFAKPAWLAPLPDRFINPSGNGRLQIQVAARSDAGQGAGLLPGQTNWGSLLLSLNGALFEYNVPVIVGPPAGVGRDTGSRIFGLYQLIAARLDALGDLDAFIGTPRYPNGAQLALGLTVDYLGDDGYSNRLAEAEFINRVAETLAQKDYNADGWLGFRPEDVVVGAPGWALGTPAR